MLNTKKSTEIIIRRPKSKDANLPPPPIPGIQRVSQLVVLGVTIQDHLSFKPHIDNLVSRCAQSFYALRVLRSHGLSGSALWDVTHATLINKLSYASPLWWGFTDASDKQRLQSTINKAVKSGFLPNSQIPVSEICQQADQALFSNIVCNNNHVLHNLLPPPKMSGHDLRRPAWNRTILSEKDNSLSRKNFIHRLVSNNYFYSNL